MHPGQGPGLSLRDLGEIGGVETVTLLNSEIPVHNHSLRANSTAGDLPNPGPTHSLARSSPFIYKTPPVNSPQLLALESVGVTGQSLPHNNMQPYLTLNFNIALQGVFPPRG